MEPVSSRERIVPEGGRHDTALPPDDAVAALSARPPTVEAAQVRADKLDLVERLADHLAHEIKNPLHSLVINLEVLRRRIARAPEGERAELMRSADVLGSELERVNRRVELLLRVVRPDRSADPVTLRDAVEELLEMLDSERDRRRLRIVFEPVAAPVRPNLPPEPVRHLVLDLLVTAMDALDEGGEMLVRTEVEGGWSRLRLGVPGRAASAAGHPRLEVARALAVELGGSVEDRGDSILFSVPAP